MHLPCADASIDVVVSGPVLNFIPDRQKAFAEMRRAGFVAFYLWDYPGGGMGFIDAFWKAAAKVDPGARDLDESARFSYCAPEGLTRLCHDAGATDTQVAAIEVDAKVPDFNAFWHLFTFGAGPAPGYVRSLSEDGREKLRDHLAAKLGGVGAITLPARAWAVKARWPTPDS